MFNFLIILIADCEEKLKSLKKESELLESRQNFPSESAAFPQTNVQEIIEPYDEEAEAEWRSKFFSSLKPSNINLYLYWMVVLV